MTTSLGRQSNAGTDMSAPVQIEVLAPEEVRKNLNAEPLRIWEPGGGTPDVTIIIVSYNTRELTLKCLETLLDAGGDVLAEVVVYDNDSKDGSPEAIAERFPQLRLIASRENVGFAKANNIVAAEANAPYVLLLNPDTETYDNAIARLLQFAQDYPQAGIYGGRTLFPDGSLNPSSCFNRITLHSQFCRTFYLDKIFPNSPLTNPEAIGGWNRDDIRQVDIVVGCFLLTTKKLWDDLGGFDLKYFMYGEEADLCLRAAQKGYTPMINPQATIMHLVGASANVRASKIVQVGRARATLIRQHWKPWLVPFGLGLLTIWAWLRNLLSMLAYLFDKSEQSASRRKTWKDVCSEWKTWIKGY